MPSKYLIPLLTNTIFSLSISPVLGQANTSSEITFSCQSDRDVPITIATNKIGETQTIFTWKKETFPNALKAHQLCNRVTDKLNNYLSESKDLSLLILQPNRQVGLPTICVTKTGINCDLVLFTLPPAEEPIDKACETLNAILDREISEPIQEQNRSIQSKVLFPISLF